MATEDAGGVLRLVGLALLAIAIWFLGATYTGQPVPKGLDAPTTDFSAARADATLGRLLGPEVPHPISSAANAAVRDRIRAEFASLGVKTQVYRAFGCRQPASYGVFTCGTTEDIIANVAPGEGRAIILMAHYDSVPAGPGASDDQSGVATVLETVRALKARGMKTMHPIIALITDGEEGGLLGAASFLDNPAFAARVGAAVNVEARGNQGPSLLFQTSAGDGPLIDLYARNVPEYTTGSLMSLIYRLLPNDTDLTLFIRRGFISFNFAFVGNVAGYHTPLDLRKNLSLSTLQQHGDNLLGVASGLTRTDFAALKGNDAIYLSVLGIVLPRMPVAWALPLAVLALALVLLTWLLTRGDALSIGRSARVIAMPLAAVLGSVALGWGLFEVTALISGHSDPSFAHPLSLRIALSLGVVAVMVLVSRMAGPRESALSVWTWMSALAVATAAFLPGLSAVFLLPALIGSILLLAQSRLPGRWSGTAGLAVLIVSTLPPLLIFFSLASLAENIQGLALHPAFTVPVALGAMCLLPIARSTLLSSRAWISTAAFLGVAAIAAAVFAGLQPAYSSSAPQRLNINLVDDHVAGRALWSVDTADTLPKALRHAAAFSSQRERAWPFSFQSSYIAPAGATRFAPPTAEVTTALRGEGRRVTLKLRPSATANRVFLLIPNHAGLLRINIAGTTLVPAMAAANPIGTVLACVTDDCRDKTVTLDFETTRVTNIIIGEQSYGLPPDGNKLAQAGGDLITPLRTGNTTIVFETIRLP